MFKFYFSAVTYGIAFLFIGVCLRKLVVNGDFIYVKFDLLVVIYGIALLFIGVYLTIVFVFHRSSMIFNCLRKLVVNGDFICKYYLFFGTYVSLFSLVFITSVTIFLVFDDPRACSNWRSIFNCYQF